MANIITDLINRIEEYRATNKNPCKNYATQAAAEKAAIQVAADIKAYYSNGEPGAPDAQYLVFYVPAWGRWCAAFNVIDLLNKFGGYIGYTSNRGFFTFR